MNRDLYKKLKKATQSEILKALGAMRRQSASDKEHADSLSAEANAAATNAKALLKRCDQCLHGFATGGAVYVLKDGTLTTEKPDAQLTMVDESTPATEPADAPKPDGKRSGESHE